MGKLVEQAIPTLFGGVSRQPASVRRLEQMETCTNALSSVVTGGIEKRPPTQTLAALTFLDTAADYAAHGIDRSSTEQYFLCVADSSVIALNAITGAQITVTIQDTTRYFLVEQDGIDATGIVEVDGVDYEPHLAFDSGETTFDWEFALSDASTVFKIEGSADGTVWNDLATGKTGASGSFSTTIDAVATGDHNYVRATITTGAGLSTDTITLKATFQDLTYIVDVASEDLRFATVADTTFIANRNVTCRLAEADSGTIAGYKQEFTDLPAASGSGNIWQITGSDADGFSTFFVQDDATTSTWIEVVDPQAHNSIDASSMPYVAVRQADGTFTFGPATWNPRNAGDEELIEAPKFIGQEVQDLTLYRNRLVILSEENEFTSQAGDVFNFWPEKATEVLDSDPIHRAATTDNVHVLRAATVFRKILFATSERAQFELTSEGAFTPDSANLDLATTYTASPISKPAAMGDVLYFPAQTQDHALVYEYYFDQNSLSNTAADVSKHTVDYIPNDILTLAPDPATSTLFALTTGEQNALFVYRTFFDGATKLQSAWGKYTFGDTEDDAFVLGIAAMSGFLVMVIQRDDGVIYLEQMPIDREEQNATVGYSPFIDQRVVVTGTYSSTYDCTTWHLSYEHMDDAVVVLGPSFSEPGRQVPAFYPDQFLIQTLSVAAGETIVINGLTFTAHASTTTVANREFDISGSDTADAGELVTCINDSTYGVSGVTATDNGDGTITIIVDDKCDGTITTPTGTGVTNGTIVVAQVRDYVAARGDLGTNEVWVGRPYEMSVKLSEQFFRDGTTHTAVLNGRLQLKDMTFNLADTGYLKVTVAPEARDSYEYTFEGKILGSTAVIGGSSIADRTSFKVPIWCQSSKVDITLSNDQPHPCVVSSAAWRGFFNEISRQE